MLLLIGNVPYLLNLVAKVKKGSKCCNGIWTLSEEEPKDSTDFDSRIFAKMQMFEWTSVTGSWPEFMRLNL